MKTIVYLLVLGVQLIAWSASAQSYLSTTADLALGFYQQVLSPVRQPVGRCQFSPSCSQYAKEAVQEHGALVGTMMAADRLMRCGVHAERITYPYHDGRYRDSPAKNYLFGNGGLWRLDFSRAVLDTQPSISAPLQFAYKLFTEGSYDYSIIELKRYQTAEISTEEQQYTQTRIAINHFANQATKKARQEIDRVDLSTLSEDHKLNSFIVDYLIADFEELDPWNAARSREATNQPLNLPKDLMTRFRLYALTQAEEYEQARAEVPPGLATLSTEITAVEESGSRSAALAGIMSAVLPGSGYMYAGRVREGFSALIFNGLFGWGVYSLFKNGNTGSGILLSALAVPFYLGNIVGASNAALTENGKEREMAIGVLRRSLGLDFYFSMDFLKKCWE